MSDRSELAIQPARDRINLDEKITVGAIASKFCKEELPIFLDLLQSGTLTPGIVP